MAKKPKRRPRKKRRARKTEKEWKDWGEKFGERMEKRCREFAEEMEWFGERFGKRMEKRGKKWEIECKTWWFRTFGFIGPLIGSIFGIICLAFGTWLLYLINLPLDSSFISALTGFVLGNLHWFFAVFIFFGYSDYFSKRYPKTYWIVSPIVSGVGAVIVIWVSVWILNLINTSVGSSIIASISNFLYTNLWGIFVVFLVLGYAFVFIKILIMGIVRGLK